MTLLATADTNGKPLATIDGSTWDPWAKRILLTTENPGAPTYAATPNFPSAVVDVSGALGRGGYEGIQDDDGDTGTDGILGAEVPNLQSGSGAGSTPSSTATTAPTRSA